MTWINQRIYLEIHFLAICNQIHGRWFQPNRSHVTKINLHSSETFTRSQAIYSYRNFLKIVSPGAGVLPL